MHSNKAQVTLMRSNRRLRLWLAVIPAAMWLGFGCTSMDTNPPTPQANTGYVDFFLASNDELAWEIQRFDDTAGHFQTVYSKLSPVKDGVLRLAFRPGTQRLRVSFLNRVIAEPASVEVPVRDGQITPVKVTLTEAGTTFVQTREQTWGSTARGHVGRRTEYGRDETKSYRVTAEAQSTKPYAPKP